MATRPEDSLCKGRTQTAEHRRPFARRSSGGSQDEGSESGCAFLAFVAASQLVSAQNPAKETVADVIVVGNRNIPTAKIMSYIRTRPGGECLQATLQADVARLTDTRMFRSVVVRDSRLGDGRVQIYFEVQEYPNLIREIIFKNANHISEKDLEDMTRLRKGTPLDPTANRTACYEIQDALKKKGRYFASVVLEEGDKPSDSRVIFNISEGPIVRVRDTRFEGHFTLANSARLRTQIDTSRAFLKSMGGIFNPAVIDGDVIKLEDYFKDHGFINVRVSRELIFSDDIRLVDVVFHVVEGRPLPRQRGRGRRQQNLGKPTNRQNHSSKERRVLRRLQGGRATKRTFRTSMAGEVFPRSSTKKFTPCPASPASCACSMMSRKDPPPRWARSSSSATTSPKTGSFVASSAFIPARRCAIPSCASRKKNWPS